jgi:hypothetical protein
VNVKGRVDDSSVRVLASGPSRRLCARSRLGSEQRPLSGGDLGVRETAGKESEHFELARGQVVQLEKS